MARTLVASRTALPPGGALRLRAGETGPAALADLDRGPRSRNPFVLSLSKDAPGGALRQRPGKAGSAALADLDRGLLSRNPFVLSLSKDAPLKERCACGPAKPDPRPWLVKRKPRRFGDFYD